MTQDDSAGDSETLDLADFGLEDDHFREDLLEGLLHEPKWAPCKYLYDCAGSQIFDRICEVKDYYPTRTERRIFDAHLADMARAIGPRAMVVEPGAGNGDKGILLLEALEDPAAYVPLEISKRHMMEASEHINSVFPDVEVLPVCADFTGEYTLPTPRHACERTVIYFPGSTIGNFDPAERAALLRSFAEHVRNEGPGAGGLLVGFDLVKDPAVIERAYDDSEGVTRAFNLNLLERANRELGADFDVDAFEHRAVWNDGRKRLEMHLESQAEQTVTIGTRRIDFAKGETIHTENSHKFTIDGFATLAAEAGLTLKQSWTDEKGWFAVAWFEVG
jgi:dimethylhistidine N-methyltransferase